MTQAWQSSIDEFQCAECGAVYGVAITALLPVQTTMPSAMCQKVMNEWHGTVGHAYTLKSQFANAQLPLIRINSSIDPYCTFGRRQS